MLRLELNKLYAFDYINYRGEASHRKARLVSIGYGNTPYHPDDQFIFTGFDMEKNENRDYAMQDMNNLKMIAE